MTHDVRKPSRKSIKIGYSHETGLSILLFAVLIIAWEAIVRGFGIPSLIIPTPSAVASWPAW